MYSIFLYHDHEPLLNYKSNILPQVGDIYTSHLMPDSQQRTVTQRSLHLDDLPDTITVSVEYTYPELVKYKKELTPIENY